MRCPPPFLGWAAACHLQPAPCPHCTHLVLLPSLQMSLLLWMNMVPSLALVVEWLDESTLGLL